MKTVGVVAEYDPFHNGHAWQLAEARRLSGADAVIVVMSGFFTQRGDPACLSPLDRAACALKGGADLVALLQRILTYLPGLPQLWTAKTSKNRFAVDWMPALAGLPRWKRP